MTFVLLLQVGLALSSILSHGKNASASRCCGIIFDQTQVYLAMTVKQILAGDTTLHKCQGCIYLYSVVKKSLSVEI